MAFYCKAKILIGYELTPGWNKIVDEDYFDKYSNYFMSPCLDGDPELFAAVALSVDEGEYASIDYSLSDKDQEVVNTFYALYKDAAKTRCPRIFIACCVE